MVEAAPLNDVATAMVRIDRLFETLPDYDAAAPLSMSFEPIKESSQRAVLLREEFRELLRVGNAPRGEDFGNRLAEAEQYAADLHAALVNRRFDKARLALEFLRNSCIDCHHRYRD